jgi:hypothetical protein
MYRFASYVCVQLIILISLSTAAKSQTEPTKTSLWYHNGSIVYLIARGALREFHYKDPRPGMVNAGAQPGSVLFQGESANGRYFGTAFIFNHRCGPRPYQVSGPILDNYSKVVLTGQAPHLGSDCRVEKYSTETLVFTLVAQDGLAEQQPSSTEPSSAPSNNDMLPAEFRGTWTIGNRAEITGVVVTGRSYHEPGYNCDIRNVRKAENSGADPDAAKQLYIVSMSCNADDEDAGPPENLTEIWITYSLNNDQVVICASTSSVRIMHREH